MRRPVIAGLILAGLGMSLPGHAGPTEPVPIRATQTMSTHSDWSELLKTYVRPATDGVNRVDYGALQASPADRERLNTYIQTIAALPISTLEENEAFAALANLYNALTIRLIVEHYPVKSITKIRPGLLSIGPWKQDIIELEGQAVSLDEIEHGMLRKRFDDPRVHYAVNCASIGCPNLQSEAWTADTLQARLDEAARDYINHPRGVTIREDGRLDVSKIYSWFREDFGGTEAGVIDHLLRYASPELTTKIRARPDIANYSYDWSLNDVPSPK